MINKWYKGNANPRLHNNTVGHTNDFLDKIYNSMIVDAFKQLF